MALALVGIGAFVWDKQAQDLPARGDLLSLFSATAWAVYSLAARRLSGRYPAKAVTAWAPLVGLLATMPVAIVPALEQDWIGIGLPGWGAMVYSSALSMLAGYSLWSWAIARRGVGRTAPFLHLVPILTGVISLVALDETFGRGRRCGRCRCWGAWSWSGGRRRGGRATPVMETHGAG